MMTRLGWSGLLAAVVAGVSAFSGAANAQTASATLVKEAAEDNARITVPATGCVLANNVWDRSVTPSDFSQAVFLEKRGDKVLPGWRWSAPGERSAVLSMPEIICGDKPWDAPLKLRPEFPFRAGERHLAADFDIDLKAEGRYDMAFSLWAVSKLPAVKENISLEIMIWTVDAGVPHYGIKTGTFQTGGMTFDVYVKPDQGVITGPDPFTWKLVEFVAQKPLLKGSIDFGVFVDELLKRKILARNEYLTSLELGDEVAEGSGEVVVKKFDVGTSLQID
jgi:hypothetical protein